MRINNNFFSSVRWKIAFAYLVVIGTGFFVINVSIMEIFEQDMISERRATYQRYAIQVAQTISNSYHNNNPDVIFEIQEFGNEITDREAEATRIMILNSDGVVDYDSYNITHDDTSLLKRNLMDDLPEVASVLAGEFIPARDLYIQTGNPPENKRVMYAYAAITHHDDGIIGMVILSTSMSSVDNMLRDIRGMLNLYSIIISISIIIISFFISGFITQPIKELTEVITKMSQGHLDQRVSVRGTGELRQLGDAFNVMSEKLENLDKARNEFVSNASHELKTPLSAIKVLVESLLHMGVEDPAIYNEFLSDINIEIDRLNAIITDLLSLVQMDNRDARIKKEIVDLSSLVQQTVKNLQPLAEKNSIHLEAHYVDEIFVKGDPLKLGQVISNLIDNGIKYTPEDGIVTVNVVKERGKAVIKVEDTGVGIPKEDLPHIFERFFRVDKARSRATGGTGLGLSIAHRIVLMHKGNIFVDSIEGEGTSFIVELPLIVKDTID